MQSKKGQSQSFVGLSNMFELNALALLSDAHLDLKSKAYALNKENITIIKKFKSSVENQCAMKWFIAFLLVVSK